MNQEQPAAVNAALAQWLVVRLPEAWRVPALSPVPRGPRPIL
jgi:hypothetical protein